MSELDLPDDPEFKEGAVKPVEKVQPNETPAAPPPPEPPVASETALEHLPPELAEFISDHPEVEPLVLAGFSAYYSGPLPPPSILEGYDRVVPGSAGKIIDQFVAQGDHRRSLESLVVRGDEKRANWGMIGAFVLSMTGLLGSIGIIVATDYTTAGVGTFVLSLAPLIGAFLQASKQRERELKRKDAQNPER